MKITFGNKSFLNENADIPEANKITDANVNEIKNVVNSNYDEAKNDIDSFYYEVNDEVEIGGNTIETQYNLCGYISGGSTIVQATLTTPKRLDNITSVAVDSLNVIGRGINGYLNSSGNYFEYVNASGYTISSGISSPNTIDIIITKSTAFTNTTNNTPIVLSGYVKVTLS